MNCNKTIYTPGPTNLRENVRRARALKTTNPDVDAILLSSIRKLVIGLEKL